MKSLQRWADSSPRTRGEAGTRARRRLDSVHLRPEEGAPWERVHPWVQDSKPSMGLGTGVTEDTDCTGSTAGAARNRGVLMKGSPNCCGEGTERGFWKKGSQTGQDHTVVLKLTQ